MTLIHRAKIKCEKCDNEFEIALYGSVNVTLNPELKAKALKGEINSGICPRCNARYEIELPFLYHDMEKEIMIWVFPEKERERAEEIKKELLESSGEFMRIWFKEHPLIIVFGAEELKEKLKEL